MSLSFGFDWGLRLGSSGAGEKFCLDSWISKVVTVVSGNGGQALFCFELAGE